MTDDQQEPEPTQQTQPKKGNPIEIPVPTRRDVMRLLEKAAHAPAEKPSDSSQ